MSVFLRKRLRLGIISLASAAAVVALVAAACGDNQEGSAGGPSAEKKLSAVATLEIFADMARQVGGERVEVSALLPPGADAHTYELPPNRVADIAEADVALMNGLGLEASTEDVIEENAGGLVVELAEGLPVIDDNPHLWLDARLAARYVERIRDAFVDLDPADRAEYEANASAYLDELGDLDHEFEGAIQSIPPENRKLVTFHDAFPYLAERYGLEVVAVVVTSPGQEPSAADVAELTERLSAEDVPAVFREPQLNARILEQAADEAGVQVLELLSDSFNKDVASYVDLMRFNMEQLVRGLGGE
ncbi:MAG: metal ABC transporter substrate-binding protein [Dehalococcoidia bacterium]|nr:metal ABC transporter substrate-binding protein [Dehalococcoidia bacterium]MDZ4278835.1 metal ABC transporter substrate-binding protein [Dehalococcoidia bacterium]